jgi:hypothetical protein
MPDVAPVTRAVRPVRSAAMLVVVVMRFTFKLAA